MLSLLRIDSNRHSSPTRVLNVVPSVDASLHLHPSVPAGLMKGEGLVVVARTFATVLTLTVTSAWTWKKISRLRLFFSHWLA